MTSRTSTRLLFSGKKCFWKSNISIEVLFVKHSPAQIIEIIAYDHALKCEAPHLYVDEGVLLMKLEGSGAARKAEENRQGLDRATVEFLFDRVDVSSCSPGSQGFEISVKPSFKHTSELDGLLIVKPVDLVAYTSPFVQVSRHANNSVDKDSLKDLLSPRSVCSAVNSPRVDVPVGIAEMAQLCCAVQVAKDIQSADASAHNEDVRMGVAEVPLPQTRKLPSPKSVTDMAELAHGAPPRPLYAKKASSNPSSPANPRIVSRRRASAEPLASKSAKADHHTSSLVPALPLKFESKTAPSSPNHSNESSPRLSKMPLLRALSSTLNTLGLGLRSSSSSPSPSQSQSNSRSSDSDSNGEAAERSVQLDDPLAGAAALQSPLMKLLALDGLRMSLPWTAGHSNKISPSVSVNALDQLELEVRPFEP